ncbi:hypothetical protein FRB99_006673 [Tulasnella sp. 403]|nr:hypothetical protein FRB99_006673 [Tulasnella sp. 403]
MADSDPLQFSGIDGVQCEEFIKIVRQRALAAGKQRDNDWIIDFVTPCFIGDALRFHATLDEEVRNNWWLLQCALLQKYPAPEERVVNYRSFAPPNPTIPSPASAPRQGLIRVHIKGTQSIYYVSRARINESWVGCHIPTTSTTEALRVELVQSGVDLSKLKIMGHTDQFNWLGITWKLSKPTFGPTSEHHSYVVGVQENDLSSSAPHTRGPIRALIWNIGPSPDYTLTPTWKDDTGRSWKLDVAVDKGRRAVLLPANIKGFHAKWQNHWDTAALSFEPIRLVTIERAAYIHPD